MAALLRQPGSLRRSQWRTIPACESVKAVKTPITYRWMSEITSAWKTQIRSEATPGEHEDPVRVDEAVAEVHELAREEAVARQHGGQPREALVRRVRGEHEDPERQRLDDVVDDRRRADEAGNVARAISERTETLSLGRASISTAR